MHERAINVLYIDDEPHNLTAFKAAFRRDYNIYLAESAEEGKSVLDKHNIHVILSDQRMPGVTGIEFFQSILNTHPEPIRILITGYTDVNAVIDAINLGQVYKYLTNPGTKTTYVFLLIKHSRFLDYDAKTLNSQASF